MEPILLKQIMSSLKDLTKFDSCVYTFKNFDKYKLHVFLCGVKIGTIDITSINKNDILNNTTKWKYYIADMIIKLSNTQCKIAEHNNAKITIYPTSLHEVKTEPIKLSVIDISFYGSIDNNTSNKIIGKYDGENLLNLTTCVVNTWNQQTSKWIPQRSKVPFYYYDITNKKIWNITKYQGSTQALAFNMIEGTIITDKFTRHQYKSKNNTWVIAQQDEPVQEPVQQQQQEVVEETIQEPVQQEVVEETIQEPIIVEPVIDQEQKHILVDDPPLPSPPSSPSPPTLQQQVEDDIIVVNIVVDDPPLQDDAVADVNAMSDANNNIIDLPEMVVDDDKIVLLDKDGNTNAISIDDKDKLIELLDPLTSDTMTDNYSENLF